VDDLIYGQRRKDIPGPLRDVVRRQGGVVSRKQALESGLTAAQIKHRITSERWVQVYAGVYSVFTGPSTPEARRWAAVLWGGSGAVLSHASAAEVHGLLDGPPPEDVHISVPLNRRVRPVPGVTIHLSKHVAGLNFPPGTLPVTSPEDTVLDIATAADDFAAAVPWVGQALRDGITTKERLRAAMAARKKLRYRAELAVLLEPPD
jgi:predicted transcriptional regulator of viral defense system